jgi:hypothetical protein
MAGMPDFGSTGARASFEPRHGETRQAGTSLISQTARGRQAVREPAHRTSERYDQAATPAPSLNQAGRRALIWPIHHVASVPAIMGIHGTIASVPWIFMQTVVSPECALMHADDRAMTCVIRRCLGRGHDAVLSVQ